jgi:hypothetical protein
MKEQPIGGGQVLSPAETAALPTVAAKPELATATGEQMQAEVVVDGIVFGEGPVWVPAGTAGGPTLVVTSVAAGALYPSGPSGTTPRCSPTPAAARTAPRCPPTAASW